MPPTSRRTSPAQAIPSTLRALRRWLRWRLAPNEKGKLTKVPDCSVRQADALRTFEDVMAGGLDERAGIGFALTGGVELEDARLFALDLDGCRDPGTGAIEAWARAIIDAHGRSYTEVTPSGTGLRQWLLVDDPPARFGRTKVKVPHAAAPNVPQGKSVEAQVFGAGAPQYVTVSGAWLPWTSPELLHVPDLGWLCRELKLDPSHVEAEPGASAVLLPRGNGAVPTAADVEAAIRGAGPVVAAAVLDATWQPLLGASEGDRSASAAFWRVLQHVLRAARGHGEAALAFVLGHTAWGGGDVEDSADPSRYTRRAWVAQELVRVAAKGAAPASAVDTFGPVDPAWQPPAGTTPAPRPTGGLLIPAARFLEDQQRDAFLIYGALPRVGLGQFFGDPGCGKTPFALSLALHVAGGLAEWFGHEVDRHGAVVYLIGEDATGIRNRLRAELAAHELTADNLPLYVSARPGQLTDPADVTTWHRAILDTAGADVALVVVDTQSRNFGAGNENDSQDMALFVHHVQTLADRLGALVLLVHHTGHTDKSRGRGSSVLFGALDASYEVTRDGVRVKATATKSKNWADPAPLVGELRVHEVGLDRKGRPVTAVALVDRPPPATVLLADVGADDPLAKLLRAIRDAAGEPVTQAELAEAVGCARGRALRTVLDRAVELELVRVVGKARGSRETTYHLTDKGLATCSAFVEHVATDTVEDVLS